MKICGQPTKKGTPCQRKGRCPHHNTESIPTKNVEGPSEECPVCFEMTSSRLTCKHPLCSSCLKKIQGNQCPLCRAVIPGKSPIPQMTPEEEERLSREYILNFLNRLMMVEIGGDVYFFHMD